MNNIDRSNDARREARVKKRMVSPIGGGPVAS